MKSSNPSNWPTPAVKEASPTFQGIKADPVWSNFRFSCIIGNPSRLLTWWHGAKSDICTVGDGRTGAIILEWCIYLLTTLNRFMRCLPSSCGDVVYCVLICHVQWHASSIHKIYRKYMCIYIYEGSYVHVPANIHHYESANTYIARSISTYTDLSKRYTSDKGMFFR